MKDLMHKDISKLLNEFNILKEEYHKTKSLTKKVLLLNKKKKLGALGITVKINSRSGQ
jgi:hypothetical protein